MNNPFVDLRLSQGYKSPEKAAQALSISRQLVRFAEAGVYESPPPKLLAAYNIITDNCGDSPIGFLDSYRKFQLEERIKSYNNRVLTEPFPFGDYTEVLKSEHPFILWRQYSGKSCYAICRAFCISIPLMQRFENQPYLLHNIPEPLTTILLQSGYKEKTLTDLQKAFEQYLSVSTDDAAKNLNLQLL